MKKIVDKDINMNSSYRLIDFIGKDDNYIKNSNSLSILVNYESLIGNVDLLEHILDIKQIEQINCIDYKSAIIIENEIKNNCIPIFLIDDFKNKDRSKIDIDFFQRHKISIPLSYVMWNVNVKDNVDIACFCHKDNRNMFSANGDTNLKKETLLKVKDILQKIRIPKTDVQRCLLISNYIQSKVQYIDGTETKTKNKIYVVEKELTSQECDRIDSVLFNNYGTCVSIANATTLLLNNPWMNVNVRSIIGSNHVWNTAIIDDELYYIDNTWSITKNPYQIPHSLKASQFTDEYILYGNETNEQLNNHKTDCRTPRVLSEEDYDRRIIKKEIKKVKRKMPLTYGNYLPIKSHTKNLSD